MEQPWLMFKAVLFFRNKLIRSGNSYVGHVGVCRGAVPVILALEDMHHVSYSDFLLMTLIRNNTYSSGYYQHLVTAVSVPTGGAAFLKVNDTTVKSLTGTFWKKLLPGAFDVPAGPSGDGSGGSDGLDFKEMCPPFASA